MLFNTIDFAVFLPAVFLIYWFLLPGKRQAQNFLIVIASYVFYGWWDWRFLALIFVSTVVDFAVGMAVHRAGKRFWRATWLGLSLTVNLGALGFFKYYNFFLDNFKATFSFFGADPGGDALNLVLPVGISFYTFQTLSYTVDVYRRKIKPTTDFVAFMAFVSFFPQLVAGPIERADNLLPQFENPRRFDYGSSVDGLRQALWGLFKKVVIADNCAHFVNLIFDNPAGYAGSAILLGAFFFAFQIYGDFSGYSDIAIGTARLFGFRLMRNFAFPYFSRDIAEFWRRWHISLSTWFRDYVYVPLGGSRGSASARIRNILLIFLVSGFWHGANWTFIAWGALNAMFFMPLLLTNKNRQHIDTVAQGRPLPTAPELLKMTVTFVLTLLAWIFFRAADVGQAFVCLDHIFSWSLFTVPEFRGATRALGILVLVFLFVLVEWMGREANYAIERFALNRGIYYRWAFYYLLVAAILYCSGDKQEFIYFQF